MKQLQYKVFITDLNIFLYDQNCKLLNIYLISQFIVPYGFVVKTIEKEIIEYDYSTLLNQLHLPLNSFIKDYRTSVK